VVAALKGRHLACGRLDRSTAPKQNYRKLETPSRSRRCGYYDFLSFERRAQEDKEFIATTNNK